MQRRNFTIGIVGSAAAWPLTARAQQPATPVVGFLYSGTQEPVTHRLRAFRQGLKDAGYVEGENAIIVYRFAENQADRLPELAADLVRRQVKVIAAMSTAGAVVVKAATATIPSVFVAAQDPVQLGLVSSLARPVGNLTGVNFFSGELSAKRLELLRDLAPAATRVAVLVDPNNLAGTESTLRDIEPAAHAMGLQTQVVQASTSRDIDAAFANFVRERAAALFVGPSPFFASRRIHVTNQSMRHGIPTTYSQREFAEVGGLMSYGTNLTDAWRQAGRYAGRILGGAKPADLPVVQATRFELVINHQTARMLGLTVPQGLLATADEVIE
jgi:putative ABC transport system substrate-binding protein